MFANDNVLGMVRDTKLTKKTNPSLGKGDGTVSGALKVSNYILEALDAGKYGGVLFGFVQGFLHGSLRAVVSKTIGHRVSRPYHGLVFKLFHL